MVRPEPSLNILWFSLSMGRRHLPPILSSAPAHSRRVHLSTSRTTSTLSSITKSWMQQQSVRSCFSRSNRPLRLIWYPGTTAAAVWPYSGKRYMHMFPPPQFQPPQHPQHVAPPGPPPMPPPSYEEDSAAQAAARGYVYAYPPYGYPGQVNILSSGLD